MFNIFLTVFFATLGFAFLDEYFFIGYLISIALFGLYQAIFMANAGGAWDNAKKIVETELKVKGTDLHAATVVGDTVGDPFKDTSRVALNPIIKFTTLFGLLAVELAVSLTPSGQGDAAAAGRWRWCSWWCRCSSCAGRSTGCGSRTGGAARQPGGRASPAGSRPTDRGASRHSKPTRLRRGLGLSEFGLRPPRVECP